MVALNFNATQVKPNTALEALPTGIYPVIITRSEEKPTKSGSGSYIELEMTVQGGEFAGRKVFDRLNTNNPNQQAVDIAYATLSAICHVVGRLQITETMQLHGIPFKVVVAKVPRDDKPDQMSNEVKGYKDINGNDPGFAGNTQGGGGQPQNNGQGGGQPSWANNGQQGQPQNGQGGGGYQQPQNNPQQGNGQGGGQPSWAGNGQGQPQGNQNGGGQQFDPNAGQNGGQQGGNAQQGQPQNNGGQAGNGDAPPWAR